MGLQLIVKGSLLSLGLLASQAYAIDFALGGRMGTLGLGLEATVGLNNYFNARLGYTNYEFDADFDQDGVDYDAELEPDMLFGLIDVHPFGAAAPNWRLTLGMVSSDTQVRGRGEAAQPGTRIGNVPIPVGTNVNATAEFDASAPYLAIGWGNAIQSESPLSFHVELGTVLLGSPEITEITESTGLVPQSEIDRERRELEAEIDEYDSYWILNLGMSYRF